jgi:uncharacterized protein (DUF433 family)
METVSRIILDPLVITVKPFIRGTRISVDIVLDLLACIRYAQEIVRKERVYPMPQQGKTTR